MTDSTYSLSDSDDSPGLKRRVLGLYDINPQFSIADGKLGITIISEEKTRIRVFKIKIEPHNEFQRTERFHSISLF